MQRHDPEGPPLILLAPKQATFQLERQLLADGEISGYTRLHIFSFERLARFVLENLGIAPPKLLSDEGRVMVLRALLMRHEDELEIVSPQRAAARFRAGIERAARRISATPVHARQTPRARRTCGFAPPNSAASSTTSRCCMKITRDWLTEHELQDANRLLDFATGALRAAIQPSTFTIQRLNVSGSTVSPK